MDKVYITSFNSKIGTIYVASTSKGICKVSIPAQTKKEFRTWLQNKFHNVEFIETTKKNRQIIDELNRYLERRLVKFRSRIDLRGTEFQKKVWREIKKVQYGKTISYKGLAKRLGVKSCQAIGRANSQNPLPIIIPCHRVIGSNSKLVGYSASLKTKEFLLRLEGAMPA